MIAFSASLGFSLDPENLISICRPGPGYRLAFVSIPHFLDHCVSIPAVGSFRTSRAVHLDADNILEPFLSPDELANVNQFKVLKKQVEWMAGRYAAKELARQFLDNQPPPQNTRVAYRPKGAPYFTKEPSLSLSISHSADYAVAGLGLYPSCVMGLDLEIIRPDSRDTLMRAAFTERESHALEGMDNQALFLHWTAKEAYLKYIGLGFHESLKKVEIMDGTIFHDARPVPSLTLQSCLPFPDYAFSMVY